MNCERNEILGEEAEQVIPIVQGEKTKKTKQKKTVQEEPPVAYMHMYAAVLFPNLGKEQKVIL